jgi:hypothetical protein
MKKIPLLVLSVILKLIGYLVIVWLLLGKTLLLINDLKKEPSFILGLRRLWSMLNPFIQIYNFQFWIFLILLSMGIGLIKLSKILKEKSNFSN